MYVTLVLFHSTRRTFIWATTPNVFIRPSTTAKHADEYDHVCYYITGFPLVICVETQWIRSVFVHISHVWCDIKRRRKVVVVFLSLKQKESQLTTFQREHSQDCAITDMQVRHHAAKATQKAYSTWNMPQLAFVPEKWKTWYSHSVCYTLIDTELPVSKKVRPPFICLANTRLPVAATNPTYTKPLTWSHGVFRPHSVHNGCRPPR